MASLQSSSILHTNPNPRIPPSSPHLNPSHLLPSSRRNRRPLVSCSGGADQTPSSQGRVDRRNMLLGLGGLYSAANLISDPQAHANPILPPEFKTCGAATDVRSGDPLDVNCCPPFSDNIVDYKLPSVKKLRVRPAAHKLDKEYLAKYEEAIRRMKALDTTDPTDPRGFTQQANIHCAYCNGAHDQVGFPGLDLQVHNSWLFFPFHRWYLYFYERILGSLIGDPTFALPFWNWDNPKGMQTQTLRQPYLPTLRQEPEPEKPAAGHNQPQPQQRRHRRYPEGGQQPEHHVQRDGAQHQRHHRLHGPGLPRRRQARGLWQRRNFLKRLPHRNPR